MLLLPQKRKVASLVLEKLSKKPDYSGNADFIQSEPVEGSLAAPYEEDEAGLESAASALLRAVERKDVKGVCAALKDFFLMVDDDSDEMEEMSELPTGEDY